MHECGCGDAMCLMSLALLAARIFTAAAQRTMGFVVAIGQVILLKFYQYVVDPATPGSWPIRFWTWLANGPLKEMMLDFFAASGNFTRRLVDVRANSKFSSPMAGPEDVVSVS